MGGNKTMKHDKSQNVKIRKLISSMLRFQYLQNMEFGSWYNERLLAKQRKIMKSIIEQAKNINEETL